MPKLRDRFSLLIGNLWLPDQTKITHLREQYPTLAKSQLFIQINAQNKAAAHATPQPDTIAVATKSVVKISEPNHLNSETKEKPRVSSSPLHEPDQEQVLPIENNYLFNDWNELVNSALNCEKCKLCYGRTHVVIERGNRQAKWMFIGEGPGEQEDLQGKPFVGASGQLLNKMIVAMGLNPDHEVYIANVVKCRPPHNRNPEEDEIAACSNYLKSQIAMVQPQMIITLGRYAAQTLLQTESAVGKLRNKIHHYADKIPLVVTYHPSYLLRTPSAKKDAWTDLQLAMKTFHRN